MKSKSALLACATLMLAACASKDASDDHGGPSRTLEGKRKVQTTATLTGTETTTATHTATATATATQTVTITQTTTNTNSGTGTGTFTVTQTRTATATGTVAQTVTITATGTRTQTSTATQTGTAPGTFEQIYTFSGTVTSTGTAIAYYTSWPHSQGNTATATTNQFVSGTGIATVTRTVTSPFVGTETKTASATVTGSGTSTGTATVTVTATVTTSSTNAGTGTGSVTATGTATGTASQTWTATWTVQVTRTATNTATSTVTNTNTVTNTLTTTGTSTLTQTATQTRTTSNTSTNSGTSTTTSTGTKTNTTTNTSTDTVTSTVTLTTTSTDTSTSVDGGTVGGCLENWRNTTCGEWCTRETQDDRKHCVDFLDCYLDNGVGPTDNPDGTCGVNNQTHGMAPKTIADQVYQCLGCPGTTPVTSCVNLPDTTPCTDGNRCTDGDMCVGNACRPGAPVTCPGDQCNDGGTCNPATGVCSKTPKPDGTTCNDGNACTKNDACSAGTCAGVAYTCDDGLSCTHDTCNGDGTCTFAPNAGGCVIDGACYAAQATNPANQCQTCLPDVSQTAWQAKPDGTECNDGNACTKNDACAAGTCGGTAYTCDDGLPCTSDACNGDGTCTFARDSGSCVIDNACHGAGDANPANECQTCNPDQSTTWTNQADGTSCNDGKPCTAGDTCRGGTCSSGPLNTCDDGDACTMDSCDPESGCKNEIVNTLACISAEAESHDGLLLPVVNCVADKGTQYGEPSSGKHLYTVVFGYQNLSDTNISIPPGDSNNVVGGLSSDAGPASPPTWFQVGEKSGAFVVDSYGSTAVTWTLLGTSVSGTDDNVPTCNVNTDGTVSVGGTSVVVDPVGQVNAAVTAQIVPSNNEGETGTVGRTEGSFGVTDNGAATYAIPLWVPPARGSVQPRLALRYSSDSGDGLAGTGWNVTGLSSISRCPEDFARDGVASAVTFDDSVDHLCLDGQRLVLVNGDLGFRYNHSGAEYRPESDRTTKVLQVGADSYGPTGFLVYTADGLRISFGYDQQASGSIKGYYGRNSSAILQGYRAIVSADITTTANPEVAYDNSGQPQVRLLWAVSAVVDRFDNIAFYTYLNSQATSGAHEITFLPHSIDYGNTTITFDYGPRSYSHHGYVRGLPLANTQLLSRITMANVQPQTVWRKLRSYSLDYYTEDGSRVLLRSVTECDGADVCKAPTTFDWTPSNLTFDRIPTGIPLPSAPASAVNNPYGKLSVADLNGDGRDDILAHGMAPNSYSGGYDQTAYLMPPDPYQLASYDFNSGVGLGDPCRDKTAGCGSAEFTAYDLHVTDFYGSGYPTMLVPASGNNYLFYQVSDSNGGIPSPGATQIRFDLVQPKTNPTLPDGANAANWSKNIYLGDFNGDGLPDLLRAMKMPNSPSNVFLFALNIGEGIYGQASPFAPFSTLLANDGGAEAVIQVHDDANIYAADFNGDGKSELMYRPDGVGGGSPYGTRMWLTSWTSAAVGSVPETWPISLLGSDKRSQGVRYQFADVNGDGLVDAIEIPNAGGDLRVAFNTGRNFLPPVGLGLAAQWTSGLNTLVDQSMDKLDDNHGGARDPGLRVVDFDGNGRADLLLMGNGCFNDGNGEVLDGVSVSPNPRTSPMILQMYGMPTLGYSVQPLTTRTGAPIPIGMSTYYSNPSVSGGCGGGFDSSQVADVNGDGLADLIQVEDGKIVVYLRLGQKPGLLQKVTDGFGHAVAVSYLPVTDPNVHAPVQCHYPQYCNARGMWVVRSHTVEPNRDAALAFEHTYSGARLDVVGLGTLGMDSHTVTDTSNQSTVTTTYDHVTRAGNSNLYPFLEMPTSRKETYPLASGQVITKERAMVDRPGLNVTNDNALWSVTYLQESYIETETEVDKTTATKRKVITTSLFDGTYGYLSNRTVETGTGNTSENEVSIWEPTFYPPLASEWLVGLVDRDVTYMGVPGRSDLRMSGSAAMRVSEYVRDMTGGSPTGAVKEVVTEPDFATPADTADPSIPLWTEYTRNVYGQITKTSTTTLDGQSRKTTVEYDVDAGGVFPSSMTNELGMRSEFLYHPGLGVLLRRRSVNGLTTSWSYDGFGRPRSETRPDGGYATTMYVKLDSPLALRVDVVQNDNINREYYDYRGLKVRSDNYYGLSGISEVSSTYDAHGRLHTQTRPYNVAPVAVGTPDSVPHYIEYAYDKMGRPTSISNEKSNRTWDYLLNRVTFRVAGDDTTEESVSDFDQAGRLVGRKEWVVPVGGSGHYVSTLYGYEAFGNLRVIQDSNGNQTVATYDVRGRRVGLSDPDVGNIADSYDALGQHIAHSDGNGKAQGYQYDQLGRVVLETETDGSNTYTWDVAARGLGLLAESRSVYTGDESGGSTANTIINRYEYDTLGHMSAQTVEVLDDAYRLDFGYDSLGRRSSITYPVASGGRYEVQFNYEYGYGYLQSVTGPSQTVLWTANARNAALKVTSETFGDESTDTRSYEPERGFPESVKVVGADGNEVLNIGYSYNKRGYLKSRTNYLKGEVETFTHDELGRLTHWGSSTTSSWATDYTYDDIGNMTARTRTGFQSGSETKTFTSGDGTACGPHALASAAVSLPDGTVHTENYAYDGAGQQCSGPGRSLTYTDFGLPRQVQKDTAETWRFLYDATHQRVAKAGPDRTTIYVGALYEKRITNTDPQHVAAQHVMYVPADGTTVAQVTQVEGSQVKTVEYIHADPLGSTSAVTSTGSRASPTIMRFEPFGGRMAGTLPPDLGVGAPNSDVTLGFTGQEGDDEFSLVNMNGRIYDPTTARFLTPDPFVGNGKGSQALNRYSYALNSPFKYTDPSGLDFLDDLKHAIGYLFGGAPSVDTNGSGGTPQVQAGPVGMSPGTVRPPNLIGGGGIGWGRTSADLPSAGGSRQTVDDQAGASGLESLPTFEQTVTVSDSEQISYEIDALIQPLVAGYNGATDADILALAAPAGEQAVVGADGNPVVLALNSGPDPTFGPAVAGLLRDAGVVLADTAGFLGTVATMAIAAVFEIPGDTNIDQYKNDPKLGYNHYTDDNGHAGINYWGFIKTSKDGNVYLTKDTYSTGTNAQAALSMDKTPTGYYQIPASNVEGRVSGPFPVSSDNNQPGGGTQYTVAGPVSTAGAIWVPIRKK